MQTYRFTEEQNGFMSKKTAGMMLTLMGGLCWGLSGCMGQYMFSVLGMDSKWLVPIRLGLAGVLMLIYCFIRYGKQTIAPWKNRMECIELLIYGLPGVAVCQFTYFLTIQLSTASFGTIMQDLSPVFIMIVMCIKKRKRPELIQVTAIILALVGVTLVSSHGDLANLGAQSTAIIVGAISGFCVMIYNVVPVHLINKYPISIMQAWSFAMGGVFLGLVFRSWNIHYVPDIRGIIGIIFVIVVGNILAFTLYMKGVSYIGPEKSILYGFSEPLVAAIVGIAFFKNPFTFADVIGFICIFLMLFLITKANAKAA
jgi:drug/metabolite transporter (DMT)-like permease